MPLPLENLLQIQPTTPQQEAVELFDLPVPEPPRSYFSRGRVDTQQDPLQIQERYREAQEARDAENQARRLMAGLNQIDPTDPNASALRYGVVSQNPLGASTDMGRAALQAFDVYQRSTSIPDVKDDTQEIIDEMYRAGASDEEVAAVTRGGILNRGEALRRIGAGRPKPVVEEDVNELAQLEDQLRLLSDVKLMGAAYADSSMQALRKQLTSRIQGIVAAQTGSLPAAPPVEQAAPAAAPTEPSAPPTKEEQEALARILKRMAYGD